MRPQGFFVCLLFYLVCPANIIGLWWARGNPLVMDKNGICRRSRKMGGRQQEICRKQPEVVEEIANGAKMALKECQYQFRYRRWNCTTKGRSLSKILKLDTRETAFVYAMTAAGAVHSLTEACSMGLFDFCSCDNMIRDKSTQKKWKWGGCGDNVDFGYKKSKEFMDKKRKRKRNDIRALVSLHNNEAGRLAVTNYLRTACKCHGLSGSCNLKTCWLKMPRFRDVGNFLKDKFDGSSKVIGSNDGLSLLPEGETIKPPGEEDLIYAEKSPNFCRPNRKFGSLGTAGRICNPQSLGMDGCDLMCCGKGASPEELIIKKNCKCQFIWCCEVVNCQTCVSKHTVYRCKG